MKLFDARTMLGRECSATPSAPRSIGVPDCTALPTPDDLRRLLAAADEQGLIARETLHPLLAAIERRDAATAHHAYRTACWSAWLAGLAHIPPHDTAALVVAALLHDIGKIAIADEILLKPCELTQAESQIVSSGLGTRIVAACRAAPPIVSILARAESNPAPDSLDITQDDARPELARILTIADAFDSLTCDQRYRKALSRSEVLRRLRDTGTRQFDPDIVSLLEFGLDTLTDGANIPNGTLHDLAASGESVAATALMRSSASGIVQALNLVSDAVCMVDGDLRVRVWNERAETLTGFPSQEMIGKTWNSAFVDYVGQVSLPREERRSLITRCLAAGTLLTERGYLWNVRGDCIPVESRAMPVRDDSQQILGAIEIIRDLSREISLQSENEQLRRVSQIDPLTKVSNRTAFERILNEQVEAVNRTGARCSLILLDIDFFKSINDTFGHPVGDLVLKSFANLLVQFIRPTDVVARYGGEEFAMLLPDCNLATAYERAERLRAEFPSLRVPELKGRAVTASLGVTEIQDGDSDGAVVVRADEALYRAKERGRNRTEVAYADTTRQDDHEYSCSWTISGTADLALLKLSGFAQVWRAETLQSEPACIRFRIGRPTVLRRVGLRHGEMPVEVQLSFSRTHISERTQVQVAIRALVGRPAAEEFHTRCCEILATLRSHLMADSSGCSLSGPGHSH
jgi:diguanylate cyclase (GGDEF)-like protein/PAS domain S-box-containing protein